MTERISIIVPVLDEEAILQDALSAIVLSGQEELVVVDGGSRDRSLEIARRFADKAVSSPRGRAVQMNCGAGVATGSIFIFLHADCRLPEGASGMVRAALADPRASAGAFDVRINHPSARFRLIEWGANARSRLTRVPYGDQALFMRRAVFEGIGGFREIPLMEDVEIAARLRKMGRIVFLRPPVTSDPRRWTAEGALSTTLRNWRRALAYGLFGADPGKLAGRYKDIR